MFNTKLSDLDDFLAPAQDCVVQLMTTKSKTNTKSTTNSSMQIELESDLNEQPLEEGMRPNLIKKSENNVATISLSDCLACNGCVTTAETMLIQQHSIDKVESLLANSSNIPCVFSISQQSIYSLCVLYETEPSKLFKVISTVLGTMGVIKVYDISLATQFILNESYLEFLHNFKSSDKYQLIKECLESFKNKSNEEISRELPDIKKKLLKIISKPVLCSECPGWICYAEKVVGDIAIPYMSLLKSPQQLQGYLLKKVANRKLFTADESSELPVNIMHICVMPCYDKKLEAVRPYGKIKTTDDISDNSSFNEVDAVIATHELADLFTKNNIDIKGMLKSMDEDSSLFTVEYNFDKDLTEEERKQELNIFYSSSNLQQTSNGYSDYILQRFANDMQKEFNISSESINLGTLEYKQIRNKDFKEVVLEILGIPVLKIALAYGFRNIQNIVRKIKTNKCEYDYVEIMACPGGCLNGGGQIKPKELNLSSNDLLENLISIQKQSLEIVDSENILSLMSLYSSIEQEEVNSMIKTAFSVIKRETSVGNLKW